MSDSQYPIDVQSDIILLNISYLYFFLNDLLYVFFSVHYFFDK